MVFGRFNLIYNNAKSCNVIITRTVRPGLSGLTRDVWEVSDDGPATSSRAESISLTNGDHKAVKTLPFLIDTQMQ